MSALQLTWIMQAMGMGGVMRVYPRDFDPMLYCAKMVWPHGPIVSGKPQAAITDAINDLNAALQEDCAKEMMEGGHV